MHGYKWPINSPRTHRDALLPVLLCCAEPTTHTQVAQAFDAGDPWSGKGARCEEPYAPYACRATDGPSDGSNASPFTPFFMGTSYIRPYLVS